MDISSEYLQYYIDFIYSLIKQKRKIKGYIKETIKKIEENQNSEDILQLEHYIHKLEYLSWFEGRILSEYEQITARKGISGGALSIFID